MVAIALVSSATYIIMAFKLPSVAVLEKPHPEFVSLNAIPKPLIQAILATEDSRFYSHPGIDIIGVARAAIAVIASGRKVQGASTITMQVARHFFLTAKKTYARKVEEMLLAIKIEKAFSKNKILELYVNTIYFGHGANGVAAAARIYYGKSLRQLTLPEMAMIAGIPQSPSRVNPIKNPKAALKRRNHVLKRMLDAGYIDQETYKVAIETRI
jgi:penicillin-binding protein 1A